MKCTACKAEVDFRINLDSNKRVPLVPHDPAYPKAVRYRLSAIDAQYCVRDNDGPLMSHFANCTNPRQFSGRNK